MRSPKHGKQSSCACGGGCPRCGKPEPLLQTKLVVGPANDQYDREADRVTDQVMRIRVPLHEQVHPSASSVSSARNTAAEGNIQAKEQLPTQTPHGTNYAKPEVSETRLHTPSIGPQPTPNLWSPQNSHPLSAATRAFMEPRFGADFSHVRLHTGPKAEQQAAAIQARAFTHGSQIWLGRGERELNKGLLAHELAHVLQQQGHETFQRKTIDNVSFEKEANTARVIAEKIGEKYINQWTLRDRNGTPLKYFEIEDRQGTIFIPEGTRVVMLEMNSELPGYIHVALWYHGHLREGYLHQKSIGDPNQRTDVETGRMSPFAVEAFLNDAHFAVGLSYKQLMEFQERTLHQFPPPPDFVRILEEVEDNLKLIEAENIPLNNEILDKLSEKVDQQLDFSKKDKVGSLERMQKVIFSLMDPTVINKDSKSARFSKELIIIPLSLQWFQSDPSLWEISNKNSSLINFFEGESGEGVQDIENFRPDFLELREDIINLYRNNPNLEIWKTREANWLLKLDVNQFNKAITIIIIHDQTWEKLNAKWASGIPIDQSIGFIDNNAVFSVLIHEINVNSPGFLGTGDTHASDDIQGAVKKMTEGGVAETQESFNNMRDLFQVTPDISIVYLAQYLRIIRKITTDNDPP